MMSPAPIPGAVAQPADDPRPDPEDTRRLLDRIRAGDARAVDELLAAHRDGLRVYVDRHFDRALRSRVDPSDVVQKVLVVMARRLPGYLAAPPMPFHLWARQTARDQYRNERRFHRAGRRDLGRDAPDPDSSSVALADRFVAPGPSPSEAAEHRERVERLARVIDQLKPGDREILLLRHVENLPHAEIACLLGVSHDTERQRYGRALAKLSLKAAGLGLSGVVS